MCAALSQMDNLNFSWISEQDVKDVVDYGAKRLEFCVGLYRIQTRNGFYFLHAQPACTRSWHNENVQRILHRKDMRTVVGDVCTFGMAVEDDASRCAV